MIGSYILKYSGYKKVKTETTATIFGIDGDFCGIGTTKKQPSMENAEMATLNERR